MNREKVDKFYCDDVIYHYTKASTAIDYILYKQQLKFSRASDSADPIESRIPSRSAISCNLGSNDNVSTVYNLHKYINEYEKKFHQICFCKNTIQNDFVFSFEGHEELFGFAKLRMWDQYADKFQGVCLAFSKDKIIEKNRDNLDLIYSDVEYLSFTDILLKKIGDIQIDYLTKVGEEFYKNQLKDQLLKSLFFKHLDYSGENEFRVGAFYDEKKCEGEFIRDEFVNKRSLMLDIEGCIQAIFVSSFVNGRQKKDLFEYATMLDIDIFEVKWQYNCFEVSDLKKHNRFINELKPLFFK